MNHQAKKYHLDELIALCKGINLPLTNHIKTELLNNQQYAYDGKTGKKN
jgi:hypothetical protein